MAASTAASRNFGFPGDHWMASLLKDIAATSEQVRQTAARLKKIDLLAECYRLIICGDIF